MAVFVPPKPNGVAAGTAPKAVPGVLKRLDAPRELPTAPVLSPSPTAAGRDRQHMTDRRIDKWKKLPQITLTP